jgi:hypothetical protein
VSEAAERLERDGLAMRVGPLVALRKRLPDGFGPRVELKDNWKELVVTDMSQSASHTAGGVRC